MNLAGFRANHGRASVYSKRVGLDKAIYQVQQAARRAGKGGTAASKADEQVLAQLRQILDEAEGAGSGISPSNASRDTGGHYSMSDDDDDEADVDGEDGEHDASAHQDHRAESVAGAFDGGNDTSPTFPRPPGESLSVEDAENPLQLLARASYFKPPADERRKRAQKAATNDDHEASEYAKVNDFFSITRSDLDIGDDVDPISLGLVEEDEAETLFT